MNEFNISLPEGSVIVSAKRHTFTDTFRNGTTVMLIDYNMPIEHAELYEISPFRTFEIILKRGEGDNSSLTTSYQREA